MKILMICGSPRPKGSTSMYLLEALKRQTGNCKSLICQTSVNCQKAAGMIAQNITNSDVIVIAFPLYVDAIPSHLLGILSTVEKTVSNKKKEITVYAIVNNGFYDADQNGIAIDMLWKWCENCGMKRGYAVGVGAGEMAQMSPLGHGPSANLGKVMSQLSMDILKANSKETVFVEPNFPRFLYKLAAHISWRQQAKKNGLKGSDITMTDASHP